jgi:hypothetical protein
LNKFFRPSAPRTVLISKKNCLLLLVMVSVNQRRIDMAAIDTVDGLEKELAEVTESYNKLVFFLGYGRI